MSHSGLSCRTKALLLDLLEPVVAFLIVLAVTALACLGGLELENRLSARWILSLR